MNIFKTFTLCLLISTVATHAMEREQIEQKSEKKEDDAWKICTEHDNCTIIVMHIPTGWGVHKDATGDHFAYHGFPHKEPEVSILKNSKDRIICCSPDDYGYFESLRKSADRLNAAHAKEKEAEEEQRAKSTNSKGKGAEE